MARVEEVVSWAAAAAMWVVGAATWAAAAAM
jgi:hypothetical protein